MSGCNLNNSLIPFLFVIIGSLFLYNYLNIKNNKDIINAIKQSDEEQKNDRIEKFINPIYGFKKVLRQYSNYDKVALQGSCKQEYFNNDVLTEKYKSSIKNIINFILKEIHHQTQQIYTFKEINVVLLETNLLGQRFIVDTFIYDVKNFYSIRILVDYVIIGEDVYLNTIELYEGSNNNVINRFDVVLGDQSYLTNRNQFLSNWFAEKNNEYKYKHKLHGISDSQLESFPVNFFADKNVKKLDINSFGKMILPTAIDSNNTIQALSSEFCKAQEIDWDSTGANKPIPRPPKCALHNTATIAQANTPYYTPALFDSSKLYKGKTDLNNAWLFKKYRDPYF